jgi:hypothetical protein
MRLTTHTRRRVLEAVSDMNGWLKDFEGAKPAGLPIEQPMVFDWLR